MRRLIVVVLLVGGAFAAPQETPPQQYSKTFFLGDSSYSSAKDNAYSAIDDHSFRPKLNNKISAHAPDSGVYPLLYDYLLGPLDSEENTLRQNDLGQQPSALLKIFTAGKTLHDKNRRDVPAGSYSIVKRPQEVKPFPIQAPNSTETTPVARVRRDVPLSSFTRTGEGEQVALPGLEPERSGLEEVQTTNSSDESSSNNSTANNDTSTETIASQGQQEQEVKVKQTEDNVSSKAPDKQEQEVKDEQIEEVSSKAPNKQEQEVKDQQIEEVSTKAPDSPLQITKWIADTIKAPAIKIKQNLPKFPSFFNR